MSSDDENEPSCIICLGPALHPVRLTCECKFTGCAECLFRWLHSKPQTVLKSNFSAGTCPTCRKKGVEAVLVNPDTGMTEPLTVGEMAKRGEGDMVTTMIALGADWYQSSEYGVSPLSAAAGAGHLSVVKMLVDQFYAYVDQTGSKEDATAFHVACENGHLEVAEFLLSKGADINRNDGFWCPFNAAARNGHLNIIKMLHEDILFDLKSTKDEDGTTALHEAACGGHVEVLMYLMDIMNCIFFESKASIYGEDIQDKYGETPLHMALYHGKKECAEFILSSSPQTCGAKYLTKERANTVIAAANGGLYDLAKRLVTEFGVDPKQMTKDRETAASSAISNVAKAKPDEVDAILDFLKFLVENGVDLTVVNSEEENLLHLGGALKLPICRYLIEEVKLSAWASSKDSTTPLYVVYNRARRSADIPTVHSIITYLEEQCRLQEHPVAYETAFSEDLLGETFLHLAVETGSIVLVQHVMNTIKSASQDGSGTCGAVINYLSECTGTPLHEAVTRDCPDIITLLLKEGADPAMINSEGQSCLHLIANRKDGAALEMLKVFIGYWGTATSIFVPDGDGRTILHQAVSTARGRRIAKLKELRALVAAPRKAGDPLPPSPEEVAERADEFALEILKFLLSHPSCTPEVLKVMDTVSGYNILHEVASNNDPHTLRFLLKHLKAVAEKNGETLDDYNVPDDCDGNYPLHIAAEYDHFFACKILLDQFPNGKYSLNTKGKFPYELPDDDAVKKLLQ